MGGPPTAGSAGRALPGAPALPSSATALGIALVGPGDGGHMSCKGSGFQGGFSVNTIRKYQQKYVWVSRGSGSPVIDRLRRPGISLSCKQMLPREIVYLDGIRALNSVQRFSRAASVLLLLIPSS